MLNLNVRARSIGRIRLAAVAACLAVFGVRSQYCSLCVLSRVYPPIGAEGCA